MTTAAAPVDRRAVDPDQTGGIGVALRDVRKVFAGGLVAVERITLDIPAGQFLAMIGPSGCGKSTLLRLIAGLDVPSDGGIALSSGLDARATARAGQIAYVFQDAHLLPWRNVLGNVAMPLELRGVPRGDRLDAARAAIAAVELEEFADRYPAQLSGGMRMRVSLARALVTRPRLLLMDEPFAALDEITRQRLDEQLRRLWAERRMTIVFVTHSIGEATFLADRAVVLSSRPARVVLDRAIDLPAARDSAVRGTPAFAAQSRDLYDALDRGSLTPSPATAEGRIA